MAKQQPQVDDLVHIIFLDHAEGDKPMRFECIGRLFKKTRWAYSVRCWGYVSDVDRAGDRAGNETDYTIVKRAIESIKVLR